MFDLALAGKPVFFLFSNMYIVRSNFFRLIELFTLLIGMLAPGLLAGLLYQESIRLTCLQTTGSYREEDKFTMLPSILYCILFFLIGRRKEIEGGGVLFLDSVPSAGVLCKSF